ncbi:hypothetical protein B7463_g4524, partial [Scytalidium lignicola]
MTDSNNQSVWCLCYPLANAVSIRYSQPQKHGKLEIFLERGRTENDYLCLSYGLEAAGREDLLPPRPKWSQRPLAWWPAARSHFGFNRGHISLALGMLYKLVFGSYSDIANQWHHAGADVQMTIRLIEAYFCRAKGKPIRGTLEAYFQPQYARDTATEPVLSVEKLAVECPDEINEEELELEVDLGDSDTEIDLEDIINDNEDWPDNDEEI